MSLNGQRAVKCSPSHIRQRTFLSRSLSFRLSSSIFFPSSRPSRFQVTLGRKRMFSPTVVVSTEGPGGWPFSRPNFGQALRAATRGLTVSSLTVLRMRRVVLTFLPASLREYETMVRVPSLLVVTVCGGSAVEVSSKSSSSAQSRLWIGHDRQRLLFRLSGTCHKDLLC